jgi:hypothetical protein
MWYYSREVSAPSDQFGKKKATVFLLPVTTDEYIVLEYCTMSPGLFQTIEDT